jgi:hypothetical protein
MKVCKCKFDHFLSEYYILNKEYIYYINSKYEDYVEVYYTDNKKWVFTKESFYATFSNENDLRKEKIIRINEKY